MLWPQRSLYYNNDDFLVGRWTYASSACQTSSLPPTGGARPVGAVDQRRGLHDYDLTMIFTTLGANLAPVELQSWSQVGLAFTGFPDRPTQPSQAAPASRTSLTRTSRPA